MPGLSRSTIKAAGRGVDLESAPPYVSAEKAQIVQNLLTGFNGRLPLRGTMRYSRAYNLPVGNRHWAWLHNDGAGHVNVLISTNGTLQTFAQIDTFQGAVGTPTTFASTVTIEPSYDRLGDVTYGIGTAGGVGPTVLAWTGLGTAPTTRNSAGLSSNSRHAVKTHLDRLFVLMKPTGTNQRVRQLSWSDIGGPTLNTDADWQDDSTGLFNKILLPSDEDAVGLARVGRGLAILREDSIYMLSGDTPATFSLRRVASVGCRSLWSICEYNDGVFFQSDRGLEFFDGSTVTTVSADVRNALDLQRYEMGVSRLNDDYLSVIGGGYWFMYHIPSQSWATISSTLMEGAGAPPAWSGFYPGFPIAMDGTRLWSLSYITRPNDGGPQGAAWTPGYDLKDGVRAIIPARYKTRFQKLGTPEESAQLHRLIVTHILEGTVNTGVRWSIDINGSSHTNLPLAAGVLPPTLATTVRRDVLDAFSEAVDGASVDVTLEDVSTTGDQVFGELQDIVLEYQTTRQRTG